MPDPGSFATRFFWCLILALGVVGAVYLLAHPLTAFVPGFGSGSQPLDPGPFMVARTVDFVVILLFVVAGIVAAVNAVRNRTRAHEQVLVLMPGGFVLSTKSSVAYLFAAMRELSASSYRGTITFTITDAATRQRERVRLDGRFGNARQIAALVWPSGPTIVPPWPARAHRSTARGRR